MYVVKKFFLLQIYSRRNGLTGIIYTAKINLKIMSDIIFEEKIKNYNLKETLKCINSSKDWEYNVAWIDTSTNLSEIEDQFYLGVILLKKNKISLPLLKKPFNKKITKYFSFIFHVEFFKTLNFFILRSQSHKKNILL